MVEEEETICNNNNMEESPWKPKTTTVHNDVPDTENICFLPGCSKGNIKRTLKKNSANVRNYSNNSTGMLKPKVKRARYLTNIINKLKEEPSDISMEMSSTDFPALKSGDLKLIRDHGKKDLKAEGNTSDDSVEYEYKAKRASRYTYHIQEKRKKTLASKWRNSLYKIKYQPMIQKVSFPQTNVRPQFNYAQPVFQEWPLFQQMREGLCKCVAYGNKKGTVTQENRLFTSELIKDALLCHNKSRLSMAILGLCYTPEFCGEMLWKVGSEILLSNNCAHKHLSTFKSLMQLLCKHNFLPEVFMDSFSSILTTTNNIQEAYEVATNGISHERLSHDTYYSIYYGNLEYVLWKLERERVMSSSAYDKSRRNWGNDDDEDDDEDDDHESYLKGNSQIAFHGHRSIKYFTKVEEETGIWDLILPKYIELLTFYEGKERAVEALHKHMENNPSNPNSYAYYLHYIDKSSIEREKLVKVLEQYCAIDPTNDWGKELLMLYNKAEYYYDTMTLLIKRLDHQACSDSFFDWHLLNMLINMRHMSKDIEEYVKENLSFNSSWAKYHFPVPLNHVNCSLSDRVLQLKTSIANLLNIDRFADCVEAWLVSKKLIHKDDVHTASPISLNISLNAAHIKCEHVNIMCELELDTSFDELSVLSTPEIISSDELEDNNEEELENNTEQKLEDNNEEEMEDSIRNTDVDETLMSSLSVLPGALVTPHRVVAKERVIDREKKKVRRKNVCAKDDNTCAKDNNTCKRKYSSTDEEDMKESVIGSKKRIGNSAKKRRLTRKSINGVKDTCVMSTGTSDVAFHNKEQTYAKNSKKVFKSKEILSSCSSTDEDDKKDVLGLSTYVDETTGTSCRQELYNSKHKSRYSYTKNLGAGHLKYISTSPSCSSSLSSISSLSSFSSDEENLNVSQVPAVCSKIQNGQKASAQIPQVKDENTEPPVVSTDTLEKALNNKKTPEKALNNKKTPEKARNNKKTPEKALNNKKRKYDKKQKNTDSTVLSTDTPEEVLNNKNRKYGKKQKTLNRDKTFMCNICNKTFFRKFHLRTHRTTHKNDKTYTCNICNKTFFRQIQLRTHRATHKSDKTFICNICNKTFFREFDLRTHRATHVGIKRKNTVASTDTPDEVLNNKKGKYVLRQVTEKPIYEKKVLNKPRQIDSDWDVPEYLREQIPSTSDRKLRQCCVKK